MCMMLDAHALVPSGDAREPDDPIVGPPPPALIGSSTGGPHPTVGGAR